MGGRRAICGPFVRLLEPVGEAFSRVGDGGVAGFRIRPDPCHGRPRIRGMRIRVVDILEMLANGVGEGEILQAFPDLERADIRACLAYAVAQLGHPAGIAADQVVSS